MRPYRKPWLSFFLDMAKMIAQQSTCARRAVGCVIVDPRNRILATGFNGVPPGVDHCYDNPLAIGNDVRRCDGASAPSGTGLDECMANHAESNALIQCAKIDDAFACYLTCSPCMSCVKMLMCTNIQHLYFSEEYPHPQAKALWLVNVLRVKGRRSSEFFARTWNLATWDKETGLWHVDESA